MKKLFAMSALIAAALLFYSASTGVSANSDKFRRSARAIPNQYIVVLDDQAMSFTGMPAEAVIDQLGREFNGRIGHIYTSALNGYSVEMTEKEAARLSEDPRVKYVEEDSVVDAQSIETNATWGIARIDQRAPLYPVDTNYEYNATGQGVNVYIIDTGINLTHPEFQGRAFDAANTSGDNTSIDQCNGHGTHVAGTVGSQAFGVAKNVTLYSVRVFPCWGGTPVSNVISGVNWVTQHATLPAVANMSLGGAYSDTLEQAVRTSIGRGITYVVSAGNDGMDACQQSPAHLAEAITVGMTDERDYKVDISNYGRCVDLFAPGAAIHSTGNMPAYPYEHIMSGTSAATPHVTGVAALYLQFNPSASPQQVRDAIVNNGTQGILSEIGSGSPNVFLYSSFIAVGNSSCSGSDFAGTIIVPGEMQYQSSSAGFSARTGRANGTLTVPNGARFKLSLESKKGSRWSVIAESAGTSQQESVSTRIKSGTFRWRVTSLEATGTYDLCSVTP